MSVSSSGRAGGIIIAAAVAVFAFVRTRSKEFENDIAMMKAALRYVAMAEAAFHLDSGTFTTDLGNRATPNVLVKVTVLGASDTSWNATVTHPNVRRSCTIAFVVQRGATQEEVTRARNAAIDGIACN